MGLFGLFCTVLTGGVFLADTIQNGIYDSDTRKKATQKGDVTWIDNKGNRRLVSTGEKVYLGRDGKIINLKTGRVIYDCKLESAIRKNERSIQEAKNNGLNVARICYPEFDYNFYYTELSTMRRIYLKTNSFGGDKATRFYKFYYTDNKKYSGGLFTHYEDEKIEITQEEFELLGGCLTDLVQYECYGIDKGE